MDLNNFWSPTGGGVRRYHLEKIEYYRNQPDIDYTLAIGSSKQEAGVEEINPHTRIRRFPAFKIPGNWGYRFALRCKYICEVIMEIRPDIIEIGSPYIMPFMVQRALKKAQKKDPNFVRPKLIGFWHADYPVTYVNRTFSRIHAKIGRFMESLAWKHARANFGKLDSIFVSSEIVKERMETHDLDSISFLPLGVDIDFFDSSKKDPSLLAKFSKKTDQLSIFFPHRFSDEKGVRTIIKSLEILEEREQELPLVLFAGTGPDLNLVEEAVKRWDSVHYLGFIKSRDEMAALYASCDLTLALSGWETFGLSILEAMSSGLVTIAANTGAAYEHITKSGAGWSIPPNFPEALATTLQKAHDEYAKFPELSQKARAYAESLSWEKCFDKQVVFYNDLL